MKLALAAAIAAAVAAVSPATAHPCDDDARTRAVPLLRLHFEDSEVEVFIEPSVKQLPALKALKGSGKFDVLEVWGYIYKAEYRMRFIYAQIPGSCVLMGQEIIEASDPY
ncbi:MAG: hypothetical protein KDK07_20495 [Bauldia sp.]|nr:hypothetical protein [Bauldia sp.]